MEQLLGKAALKKILENVKKIEAYSSVFHPNNSVFSSAYAIKSDGSLLSWGSNNVGQLGSGSFDSNILIPTKVEGLSLVDDLVVSYYSSFGYTDYTVFSTSVYAILSDNSVWSWGSNDIGQLGDGTKTRRYTPVFVQNNIDKLYAMYSDNQYSVYTIKTDGSLWSWGYNGFGQIGGWHNHQSKHSVESLRERHQCHYKLLFNLCDNNRWQFVVMGKQ